MYPLLQQISYWPFLLIPLLVVGVIAIITLILLPFFYHQPHTREYEGDGTAYGVLIFIFFFFWASKYQKKSHHFISNLAMNT